MSEPHPDRMSDRSFRMMSLAFRLNDLLRPVRQKRLRTFGIEEGMTVVDYGCGPGRYTLLYSKMVGPEGKVIAVDIQELALEAVNKKIAENGLNNVEVALAIGYDSGLLDHVADRLCALDMFFMIDDQAALLSEFHRITRADGILIIDDNHQPRAKTKARIAESGLWRIVAESEDHLKCSPLADA